MSELSINTYLQRDIAKPKWLLLLLDDLQSVTRGTFRVGVIGLRADQIERVEAWCRKQMRPFLRGKVAQELNQKPMSKVVRIELDARLEAMRWTEFNGTPVKHAGTH